MILSSGSTPEWKLSKIYTPGSPAEQQIALSDDYSILYNTCNVYSTERIPMYRNRKEVF